LVDLEQAARQKAAKQPTGNKSLLVLLAPHSILRYWKLPSTDFEVLFVHGLSLPKGSCVYLRRSAHAEAEVVFSRDRGTVTVARVREVAAVAVEMFLTDRWDGDFNVLRAIVVTSIAHVMEEIPGVTLEIGKKLVQQFGSVGSLSRASIGELQAVDGIEQVPDVSSVSEAVGGTALPELDELLKDVALLRRRVGS
jgi:hypothetical protein